MTHSSAARSTPRGGGWRASSAAVVSTRPSSMRASSSAMRLASTTRRSPPSRAAGSPPRGAGTIAGLSARRLGREPVARILGRKEFWGLPLKVNAETLLPRPETETVVEAALAALDCEDRKSPALRIVDLGTGAGALLLAL